jgi:UDP-glucose 4-epimerase
VREVIDLVTEVTGIEIAPEVAPRRAGDPARIVASVERIREQLGWTASYDLRQIVESAWEAWQVSPVPKG